MDRNDDNAARTYLGLDAGTTNVKAVLVDGAGKVLARGACQVPVRHLPDGGAEQDIDELFEAVVKAVGQVASQTNLRGVQAVGVSSQGGALQLLDENEVPIGPVISWMDLRGVPYDQKLTRELGEHWFAGHVGHGSSAVAVGQIMRLRDQLPQLLTAAARVGFVGDIIVRRLCGRWAHHATSLSIATLYNPYLGTADPELLRILDLRESQLPALLPATQAAGLLSADIAARLSLPAGIPVSAAVHDQYAAVLGSGACGVGDVNFGSGTAWVLLATADKLSGLPVPQAFASTHVLDGRYGHLLSLGNVGSVFEAAAKATGLAGKGTAAMDEAMLSAPAGCDGLGCWPNVAWPGAGYSEATNNRLLELSRSHKGGQVLRAVVEGLSLELARYLDFLRGAGCPVRRLVMTGKAASSRVTPQVIADVTGVPLAMPSEGEASAFGAAVLARGMVDSSKPLEQLSAEMTRVAKLIQPGPDRPIYQKMYAEYMKQLKMTK